MKKIKTISIKPIWLHFNLDIDNDNVPDYKDCKPFDQRYQHISQTMKKRIEDLPIVASPTSIQGEQEQMWKRMENKINNDAPNITLEVAPHMHSGSLPHIMSKEAKEQSPDARKLFLATVKKYPGVISEIERTQPKHVVVTSLRQSDKGMPVGWTSPTQEIYIGPQTPYYSKEHNKKVAKTIYHELKHVEQLREKPIMDVREEFDKPFLERPMEQEAMEQAEQKMKEYHKGRQPSGKAISKVLELD